MPTLSRRSSRSTSTSTTLRSPKPPGWSGSTKSTPAKAKNGASAALSYVFAEPEMANLGDGLGAATTLSSSTSAGRSMSEDQSTPDGQNNGGSSMPVSPTPTRKATWYGSLSRSRGRKPTQQLVRVEEPQPDPVNSQPRPNIVMSPSAEAILSESPTALHEEQALMVERSPQEPPVPMPVAEEAEIAPPPAPSPAKRSWFSSTAPTAKPTPTDATVARQVPTTPPPSEPTAMDTTISPVPAPSSSPASIQTPSAAFDLPDTSAPALKPQEPDTTTAPTPPVRVSITPKRGWFSSSATPTASRAAAPTLPPENALIPDTVLTATTPPLPPPEIPALVLPAPPDLASVMEKIEVAPTPSPEQMQPALAPPPPPARRSWFSSYTPTSTTASSSAPAPTLATPPRSTHSIPSSLDDEVPVLSSLPFPASGSGRNLSMNPITPPPSVSGLPAPSSPTPSRGILSPSSSSGSTARPEPRQRLSSLSSLNPSTSRFTLSIPLPLLGRAKVPLPVSRKEEAKDVVEEDVGSQEGKGVPHMIDPMITESTTMNTATTTNTTVTTNLQPLSPALTPTSASTSTATDQQPSPSHEPTNSPISTEVPTTEAKDNSDTTTAPASNSWWSYVGWSSAPAPAPSSDGGLVSGTKYEGRNDPATGPDAKHVKDGEATAVATSSATTTTTTTITSVPPSITPMQTTEMTKKEKEKGRKSMNGGNSATSKDTKLVVTTSSTVPQSSTNAASDSAKPMANPGSDTNTNVNMTDASSMKSQGTASQAWYSPWAWYGSSSATNTTGGGEGEKDTGPKTEAELVKEAALAREEAPPPLTPEPPKEEPKQEEHNPVEKSFETHRGGWAAFFSSRALGIKLIKGPGDVERDESGMEVMEVDFGEDNVQSTADGAPEAGQSASTGAAAPKPSDGGAVSPGAAADAGQSKGVDGARGRTGGKKNKGTVVAPPLTISDSVKRDVEKVASAKRGSPAASVNNVPAASKHVPKKGSQSSVKDGAQAVAKKGSTSAPTTRSSTPGPGTRTQVPNLVLPTWADTFHAAPRNLVPLPQETTFGKTMKFVSGVLFTTEKDKGGSVRSGGTGKGKTRTADEEFLHFGRGLPRAWDVIEGSETKGKGKVKGGSVDLDADVLRGCKRVVVIGIHGWFPGAVMRTVLGEPTGTSSKFVNMMVQALEEFEVAHGVKLEKVTKMPLEGEGTISGRVQRLYTNLQANTEWMEDLHSADAIIVATHSQGSIVSTHLLDRLIQDGHIRTKHGVNPLSAAGSTGPGPLDSFSAAGVEALASVGANAMAASGSSASIPNRKPQRICCLALCGIHLGPLRYLSSSSLLLPYIQYFESTAAKELFEFQNTESDVSKEYVKALSRVVDQGTKMVYVASLNDQVVPLYSGLFTAVSHPLILRALYIDGDAYHSSDFLSNLLVLLLRILNSGISDSRLLAHLSEATAGSLNGVGHSTAYEEISTYALAVKYLFLTDDGFEGHPELMLEPFNANNEQNDYEIPWSLRDVIADERVAHFFGREISELRDAFREWHPKTTILRDLKRKLQPIQRLPPSFSTTSPSSSKL